MSSWIDLLGTDTDNVIADDEYISRSMGRTTGGKDAYMVLMKCDNHQQALDVLETWKKEVNNNLKAGVDSNRQKLLDTYYEIQTIWSRTDLPKEVTDRLFQAWAALEKIAQFSEKERQTGKTNDA